MDEVYRRLPAVLHLLMTLVAIPYVLLAAFFVFVGHVASQRGLWAILNTFLDSFNWTFTWGILVLGVTLITICVLGFIEPLQWWANLGLGGLMLVTLFILFSYGPSPSVDELVFLSPAFLILATCIWKLFG